MFVFKMGCFCETCILYCFLTTTLLEMWWPAIRALTLWHPCSFWSFIGPSGGMEAHDSERQQAKTLQCRGLFEICFNNNLHCLLHLFFIYCSLIHYFSLLLLLFLFIYFCVVPVFDVQIWKLVKIGGWKSSFPLSLIISLPLSDIIS